MSGPHRAKLDELRFQRGVIDQAITALEILNGDRETPMPVTTETYTAVPSARKALPPAPTRHIVRKAGVKLDGRRSDAARGQDEKCMTLLKQSGALGIVPAALRRKLNLTEEVAHAMFQRLKRDGRLVVVGRGRGTRYALPKEAP